MDFTPVAEDFGGALWENIVSIPPVIADFFLVEEALTVLKNVDPLSLSRT